MLKENKRYFQTLYALFVVVFLICASLCAYLCFLLVKSFPHLRWAVYAIKVILSLSAIASRLCTEAKCSWVFLILALPYLAIPTYLVFRRTRLTKNERQILEELSSKRPKTEPFSEKISLKCNEDFTFLREIAGFSNATLYSNTAAKHFSDAKEMLKSLRKDILNAKRFIFLEFYTVASGEIFGDLALRLIEKAREGVEVRILYDELGSLGRLPEEFISLMKERGINAVAHASLSGSFPSAINNRNHRKIAIIDGEIAYTGGINLADEYAYSKKKLGVWRDSAIKIEGEGVCELTYTFLCDFAFSSGVTEDFSKYYKYRKKRCDGKALIFGDGPSPIYKGKCAKRIIISMLNASEKYFIATTPYLVCDGEILSAVSSAVNRGVKVKIIIPGIADKRLTGLLTRHYASELSDIGAEILIYSEGFLHCKEYICDGKFFMCGSVNLDYRSLYHNFENGILFAYHAVIEKAKEDIDEIILSCEKYEKKREPLFARFLGAVMEVFAPLF